MYENFSIITFNAYAKKIFENDQERAKEYIQKDLIDVSDTTAPTTIKSFWIYSFALS